MVRCCIEKIVEAFLAQGLGGVSQSFLSFPCRSGLDLACPVLDTGESSISELDSRLRGNDVLGINVRKR
jgi:hypothetical protein